jgi:hypothetical protein
MLKHCSSDVTVVLKSGGGMTTSAKVSERVRFKSTLKEAEALFASVAVRVSSYILHWSQGKEGLMGSMALPVKVIVAGSKEKSGGTGLNA